VEAGGKKGEREKQKAARLLLLQPVLCRKVGGQACELLEDWGSVLASCVRRAHQ